MTKINIICPRCSSEVGDFKSSNVTVIDNCLNCNYTISKIEGVPCLHDNEENLNLIHKSSTLPKYSSETLGIPFIEASLKSNSPTLQIGGGLDTCNASHMIKTDAYLYSKNLHLLADAHCLPFQSESFSFVYALAVFEHLHSPWVAADEIYRVLKPHGKAYILTAFMQHLHGYPNHYFNMTKFGLERIFSNFKILEIKSSKYSSFDQLSYILLDFNNFVKKSNLNPKKYIFKERINNAVNTFCSSVCEINNDLLNQNKHTKYWDKIAPSIEIIVEKN